MKMTKTKPMTRMVLAWSYIVVVLGADAFSNHMGRRSSILSQQRPGMRNVRHDMRVLRATGTEESDALRDDSIDDKKNSPESLSNNNNSVEDIPRGGGLGAGSALKKGPPPQPTLGDYRKFALPCLGLWVAQPLLSLVDTIFVGLSGDAKTSASQLAALGPATTFFDGATYLFAFLNVATTNLYSSAKAQRGEQSEKAESVVKTASRVATRCGIGLFIFLMAFSRPLMALYIGKCRNKEERTLCGHF